MTQVGTAPGRRRLLRWLRDAGVQTPSSPQLLDWDRLRLDVAGDRLFLSGRTGEAVSMGNFAIMELDTTTLDATPVALWWDADQYTIVQGIHGIDGRAVAHIGGGEAHGSMVLRPGRVATRVRPLIETLARVTTPTRTTDGWIAAAMVAGTFEDGTPAPFVSEVVLLTSSDGRTFEVAAELEQPPFRDGVTRRFSINDALFDADGSGVLVGSHFEQDGDPEDSRRVPMVVEVDASGALTPVYDRRQDEVGAVTAVMGPPGDPSFTGYHHPDPSDHSDRRSTGWVRRGRGFVTAPLEGGQSCDGEDSWIGRAVTGEVVVGSRGRGGGTSEPVIVLSESAANSCLLPRAFGAMTSTESLDSVVELSDGRMLLATSEDELWLLESATETATPPSASEYVAPTGVWAVVDTPSEAYARRVLVELYGQLVDLGVDAQAAMADGVTPDERATLRTRAASLFAPEHVDEQLERILDGAWDDLRRSPGQIGISDVSPIRSTRHCMEFAAAIDFGPVLEGSSDDGPSRVDFVLVRHDASAQNPTGWAFPQVFNQEGC